MSALRRLHRRLDALPQWLQIVAAVGALALALGLGALVLNATDGQSAADEAAYDNGLRLARSMTDGVSSRDEIASACFAALSAAQASNQGIEATYTSEQEDAFRRGCTEGAPGVDAEGGETTESAQTSGALTRPDGSAVPADLADAYAQGQEMGTMILAEYRTDAVSFERLVDRWYQATVDYNVAMARQYAAAGRDPEGFPVLMPDGTMVPMRFSLYPDPESQLNAFRQGALDAWDGGETEADATPSTRTYEPEQPDPSADSLESDGATNVFKTPSGNIVCRLRRWAAGNQLECILVSALKGWSLTMTRDTSAWHLLPGTEVNTVAPVLSYGHDWRWDTILCRSESRGLTCRDSQTRRGFFLSRNVQRTLSPGTGKLPPGRRTVGTPSVYEGHFTSVDRLQRCYAQAEEVWCTSGPSGQRLRLIAGVDVYDQGAPGSRDVGGPSMPMGTTFRTPSGQISCGSSSRGITCLDGRGLGFTIGDRSHRIHRAGSSSASPGGGSGVGVPSTYDGSFTSVDRLQRCYATADSIACSSGPSGKAVSMAAGGSPIYEGVIGSVDNGGPSMPMGASFTTPGGLIVCESSSRGISCRETVNGLGFTIGDQTILLRTSDGTHRR